MDSKDLAFLKKIWKNKIELMNDSIIDHSLEMEGDRKDAIKKEIERNLERLLYVTESALGISNAGSRENIVKLIDKKEIAISYHFMIDDVLHAEYGVGGDNVVLPDSPQDYGNNGHYEDPTKYDNDLEGDEWKRNI